MSKKKNILIVFSTLFIVLWLSIYIIKFTDTSKTSPLAGISPLSQVKVPILMYHYVEYNQDERDFLRDRQNVPPNIFEQQIIGLKEAGYTFVTPKDIPNLLRKNDLNAKYVILSFDDGFRDFYTDVYPIIKKHNIPVISYVIFNFMNGQDYMTTEMVEEISSDKLIEIGAHTLNHAYLEGIDTEFAEEEISLSKKLLEEKFNVEIVSFAYPYGDYDEAAINLVKKAGFTNAVTVETGNLVTANNIFTLKRIRPGHLTGKDLIDYINR